MTLHPPRLPARPRQRWMAWWRPIGLAALVAVSAPLLSSPAMAQVSRQAAQAPQITGFDVQPSDRLVPGADLVFTVWGTPGATATLDIAGASRKVYLQETRPGVYEGVYTLSTRDRVAPDAHVVAQLRRGNVLSTAALAEPLQQGWQPAPVAVDTAPAIRTFTITQAGSGERRAGNRRDRVLLLRVDGTPGARVWAMLPGAENRRIRLNETSAGVYTAQYTVTDADQLQADADATAVMRLGERRVDTTLPRALSAVSLPASKRGYSASCTSCGTVVAVNRLQVSGDASPVGTVAGGVLGAVIGSQFGKGDGRTAAGVAGAVAGGVIGHEIDKRRNLREQYEVVVRMSDGSQRTVNVDADPQLRQGDAVRVVDGKLQPAAA